MKAYLKAVRISPKKANLVAKMVRGLTVQQALISLERTNKKAARLLEQLVQSAIANAQHNDKQDVNTLVIKSLIVNKAQCYHRGVPMARGRMRPMRKFLSHITLTLGVASDLASSSKKEAKDASQKVKKPVKTTRSIKKSTSDREEGSNKGKTASHPSVSGNSKSSSKK